MRKYILPLTAIALIAPTAAFAGTLPVKTIGAADRPVVLAADGDQSRHWRSHPEASHERYDDSFALPGTTTGFSLQAPPSESFGAGSAELRGHPAQQGGTVSNSHAGPAARLSR